MESTVTAILEKLDGSFPPEISFLPVTEPFRYLVTVILSASSTDKAAAGSAEKLFSAFPTAREIAGADVEEIEALIHSSGLFRTKARNIRELAAYVDENGIPDTVEALMELPGVGEKTASCYASAILGLDAVVVDTHFHRVAGRLGLCQSRDRSKAAREVRESVDRAWWNRLSSTANALGRTYCRPRPSCASCPLSPLCPSSQEGEKGKLHS